jgi:aminocarboxymuconate-semialdehyde decarboxylase
MEPIALDVHAHLLPVLPDRLAGLAGVSLDQTTGFLTLDGHRIGLPALYKPEALIAWMDKHAVAHAFVSAPPPTYRPTLTGRDAAEWAAYLTTGLSEMVSAWPDRLSVLPHLPMQDCDAAQAAAVAALAAGYRRFSLPALPGTHDLSDKAHDPLWKMLDDIGAFVFVHPGECADGRLSAFYLANTLGNPYETTVAIAHLVFGGVVERYANIQFCFAHGGGAAAMLAGRFEQAVETKRPGIDLSRTPPRALLQRLCVDCIVHDEAALDMSEAAFGPANLLFGSDWPFPMGLMQPHRQLASTSSARRRRMFCDNPERLGLTRR